MARSLAFLGGGAALVFLLSKVVGGGQGSAPLATTSGSPSLSFVPSYL